MNLNEFAKEVHENAVAHGWWEKERSFYEICALIHSELSEALEEYRAGRPDVWHRCLDCGQENTLTICENCTNCIQKAKFDGKKCEEMDIKPDGITVELIDACIRILDYFGKVGTDIDSLFIRDLYVEKIAKVSFPDFINRLHDTISVASISQKVDSKDDYWIISFVQVIECVFSYVINHGLDPEIIMIDKHEYNKNRPYKHGGKVC